MAEDHATDAAPARDRATTGDDIPAQPADAAARPDEFPVPPTAEQGPGKLHQLPGRSWLIAAWRAVKAFRDDDLGDWGAALTYYSILSIFPGLLLLVTALRLTGTGTMGAVMDNLGAIAPGNVNAILDAFVTNLGAARPGTTGIIAIVSLAGSLWSASGYVGAFMRASNAIYDVPEGRPIWQKLPIRIGLTLLTGVLLTASAVIVVFTGRLASLVGGALGIGPTAVAVWGVAKWPVLVAIVAILFDILYWASPNARHAGFRWVTPGGVLGVLIWVAASGGFAVYVSHFGSYNKTYGSLAAAIIFLVWLWISNLAVLLGAEFDAELQRGRAIRAGHPEHEEPYVQLRRRGRPDRYRDRGIR